MTNIYLINGPYELKSPYFPLQYPTNVGCWWQVYSSNRNSAVLVEVISFLTETLRDLLRIEPNGVNTQSFVLHGQTKMRSMLFITDVLYISFIGDSTVQYTGFQLQFTNVLSDFGKWFLVT